MKENTIISRMPKELRWKKKPGHVFKKLLRVLIPLSVMGLLILSFIPGVSGNFWQKIRLPELRSVSPTFYDEQGFLETNAAIQATATETPTIYFTDTRVPEAIDTLILPVNSSGTVTIPTGFTGTVTKTFIFITFTPSKTPTITPSKTKVTVTPSITLTPIPSSTPETPVVTTEPPPPATTVPPPPVTTEPPPPGTTEPPIPT